MSTQPMVASNKTIGQLTEDQRKARYETLRAKLGKSKLEVRGKKGIHYFWASRDDSNEMARLDLIGYSIVREPNAAEVLAGKAEPVIQANGLREDGTYILGDVILVCCPEETYEFLLLNDQQKHEDMVAGAQRDFRDEAEKLAVPVFDHTKK